MCEEPDCQMSACGVGKGEPSTINSSPEGDEENVTETVGGGGDEPITSADLN